MSCQIQGRLLELNVFTFCSPMKAAAGEAQLLLGSLGEGRWTEY